MTRYWAPLFEDLHRAELSLGARVVYAVLHRKLDGKPGKASERWLAELLKVDRRTVRGHLQELEKAGLIRSHRKTGDKLSQRATRFVEFLSGSKDDPELEHPPTQPAAADHDPVLGQSLRDTSAKDDPELDHDVPQVLERLCAKRLPPTPHGGAVSPLRATIAKRWGIPDATRSQRRRLDRLVGEFESHGATTEQIESRAAAMAVKWPKIPQTPETLSRHWSEFEGTAQPSKLAVAVKVCMEQGHTYADGSDRCSRCDALSMERRQAACERSGHDFKGEARVCAWCGKRREVKKEPDGKHTAAVAA